MSGDRDRTRSLDAQARDAGRTYLLLLRSGLPAATAAETTRAAVLDALTEAGDLGTLYGDAFMGATERGIARARADDA